MTLLPGSPFLTLPIALALGATAGLLHLAALRRGVRLLLVGRPLAAGALLVTRFAALGAALIVLGASMGAQALVAGAGGVLIARWIGLTRQCALP